MTKPNDIRDQDAVNVPSPSSPFSPFTLASGLLWSDRYLLIPWYLVIISPDMLTSLFDISHPSELRLLSAAFELLFLWWVGRRHLLRLFRSPMKLSPLCLILFIFVGSAFSVIPSLPLIGLSTNLSPQIQLIFLGSTVGMAFLAYLYFFWFFPFQAGISSLGLSLRMARSFTSQDWKAPFKVMLAPAGIMLLIQGLLSIPAPDGRVIELAVISDWVGGIYWCLSSYLGLAFALTMLSDREWHELNLDSYRQSRFTTLAVTSRPWLEKSLRPSFGFQVFALCILVWVANSVRLASMPPAPSITIGQIELEESIVRIQLNVSDPIYSFHGFRPAFFRLAGAQRTVISPYPEKVWLKGEDPNVQRLLSLPHDRDDFSLMLEFKTSVAASELHQARDLYLWYGGIRLQLLPMEQVPFTDPFTEPPSGNSRPLDSAADQAPPPVPEAIIATPLAFPTPL